MHIDQARRLTSESPTLLLRGKRVEFEASLGHMVRLYLKSKSKNVCLR